MLRSTHHRRTTGGLTTRLNSSKDSSPHPSNLTYGGIQVGMKHQLVSALTIHFVDECVFRIPTGKYGPPDGPRDIFIIGDIIHGPDNFHIFLEVQTVGLDNEILISLCCTDTPFKLYQGTPIAQAFFLHRNYSEQVSLNPTIMWAHIVGSNKLVIECNIFCKGEKFLCPRMMDTRVDITIITRSECPSNCELQPLAVMI